MTVHINLWVGAQGNTGESEKATGAGYDFSINHTLFFLSVMVHRPQCAVACFSAPVLIDPFASTAPEQAHQSLCVSLPDCRPPATIRTSPVWQCATARGHTHTPKHSTISRWPYVVHLKNKSTHWGSHEGFTCPFPGKIPLPLCYWLRGDIFFHALVNFKILPFLFFLSHRKKISQYTVTLSFVMFKLCQCIFLQLILIAIIIHIFKDYVHSHINLHC